MDTRTQTHSTYLESINIRYYEDAPLLKRNNVHSKYSKFFVKSILLNLDPQKWLDTLESLTFQHQNHKKPLKMSKLAFLEKFAKKLFHV